MESPLWPHTPFPIAAPPNHIQVLTELGSRIAGALRKIGETTVIDEEDMKELLKEVCNALLESDVRVGLVMQFRNNVKTKCNVEELPPGVNRQKLIKVGHETLVVLVVSGGGVASVGGGWGARAVVAGKHVSPAVVIVCTRAARGGDLRPPAVGAPRGSCTVYFS